MMRRGWIVAFAWLALSAQAAIAMAAASPGVHAFLDRDHVSLGQVVTLNIDSSGAIGAPQLAPLERDFQVLGTSRSSSTQIVNGVATTTSQVGIALRPKHAGNLTIPPLDVGGASTPPLTVQVGAAPAGGSAKVGDPVFLEADVLSSAPYVGQQTIYTVRLFYQPGVDGSLGDPTVAGARLVQLERDHRYTVMRDGYAYQVIERSWALIPQRTGDITIEGPAFQGQRLGVGRLFNNPNAPPVNPNALLNGPLPGVGMPVQASAPAVRIDARAAPANAGKPWLPARAVELKLTGLPDNGEVDGSAPLAVTLGISASGQPADALPEPELPPIAGARVYPGQPTDTTDDSGQWLRGTRTRTFAIVPERDGTLHIPEITLAWWNVEAGRSERATLPARTLQVVGVAAVPHAVTPPPAAAPTTNARAPAPSAVAAAAPASPSPAGGTKVSVWRAIALVSVALWIVVLVAAGVWWWRRRDGFRDPGSAAAARADEHGALAATRNRAARSTVAAPALHAKPYVRALQRSALDAARRADPAACEHALLAWARAARPDVTGVGMLRDGLSDPAQREALDGLQRVRWQGGDAAVACAAVAGVFAHGFAWRNRAAPARARNDELPPLYPS